MKIMKGGETFWEGFVRGFLSVFKPGAKIIGGIATALGFPEIGIPVGVIADAF